MSRLSNEDEQSLDALRRAVTAALDRKRRLGQYAIVWKDGKPVRVGSDSNESPPSQSADKEIDTPRGS